MTNANIASKKEIVVSVILSSLVLAILCNAKEYGASFVERLCAPVSLVKLFVEYVGFLPRYFVGCVLIVLAFYPFIISSQRLGRTGIPTLVAVGGSGVLFVGWYYLLLGGLGRYFYIEGITFFLIAFVVGLISAVYLRVRGLRSKEIAFGRHLVWLRIVLYINGCIPIVASLQQMMDPSRGPVWVTFNVIGLALPSFIGFLYLFLYVDQAPDAKRTAPIGTWTAVSLFLLATAVSYTSYLVSRNNLDVERPFYHVFRAIHITVPLLVAAVYVSIRYQLKSRWTVRA